MAASSALAAAKADQPAGVRARGPAAAVCVTGGALSLLALGLWAVTLPRMR